VPGWRKIKAASKDLVKGEVPPVEANYFSMQ